MNASVDPFSRPDPFALICERVGMVVIGDKRRAVEELLEPIQMPLHKAISNPEGAAREITAYLDDLVRHP